MTSYSFITLDIKTISFENKTHLLNIFSENTPKLAQIFSYSSAHSAMGKNMHLRNSFFAQIFSYSSAHSALC